MSEPDDFHPVWKALADPTRRRLLDLLSDAPMTTGELTNHFDVSRFAIMKHLGVLEEVGLITTTRRGRERWNYICREPLTRLYERWLSQQTAWEPTLESPAPAPEAWATHTREPLKALHIFVRPEEKYPVERALQSVIPPVYTCVDAVGRGDRSPERRAQLGKTLLPKVGFILTIPESYLEPVLEAVASVLKMEGGPGACGTGWALVCPVAEEVVIGASREGGSPSDRVFAEGWAEAGGAE